MASEKPEKLVPLREALQSGAARPFTPAKPEVLFPFTHAATGATFGQPSPLRRNFRPGKPAFGQSSSPGNAGFANPSFRQSTTGFMHQPMQSPFRAFQQSQQQGIKAVPRVGPSQAVQQSQPISTPLLPLRAALGYSQPPTNPLTPSPRRNAFPKNTSPLVPFTTHSRIIPYALDPMNPTHPPHPALLLSSTLIQNFLAVIVHGRRISDLAHKLMDGGDERMISLQLSEVEEKYESLRESVEEEIEGAFVGAGFIGESLVDKVDSRGVIMERMGGKGGVGEDGGMLCPVPVAPIELSCTAVPLEKEVSKKMGRWTFEAAGKGGEREEQGMVSPKSVVVGGEGKEKDIGVAKEEVTVGRKRKREGGDDRRRSTRLKK